MASTHMRGWQADRDDFRQTRRLASDIFSCQLWVYALFTGKLFSVRECSHEDHRKRLRLHARCDASSHAG
jgi:hypothetical protein